MIQNAYKNVFTCTYTSKRCKCTFIPLNVHTIYVYTFCRNVYTMYIHAYTFREMYIQCMSADVQMHCIYTVHTLYRHVCTRLRQVVRIPDGVGKTCHYHYQGLICLSTTWLLILTTSLECASETPLTTRDGFPASSERTNNIGRRRE